MLECTRSMVEGCLSAYPRLGHTRGQLEKEDSVK